MNGKSLRSRLTTTALASIISVTVHAGEWSGSVGLEYRGFAQAPLDPDQHRDYLSAALQPEYVHTFEDSKDSLRFTPFLRTGSRDRERNHADLRELAWLGVGESHEWRIGIRKVFWGVVESQHLVDIVNQTDLVENLDGEEKLGQPMFNLALIRDWGTLDLFVLPYFRERTFAGAEGRLRTALRVDTDQAVYESAREQKHVDYAARWSKSWSGVDIGISYFDGTGRDPRLMLGFDRSGAPVLVPHYDQIRQVGLDLAAPLGSWLLKLEAIHRRDRIESYNASTAGIEYTFARVFDSDIDLGALAEYLYDERGKNAPTPFQNDVMLGLRLALNDVQSSELLLGVISDRDSDARMTSLEASRRVGEKWKLTLEARAFSGVPPTDPLYSMRRDDYVQLELTRYF
jgi:hypothetical protein